MADGYGADNGTSAPGQRHSGAARSDWLALMLVGTLMVLVLVVVANMFTFKPTAKPSASPSLVAVAPPRARPTPVPTPTSSPIPTLPPTPTPSWGPTLPPTPPPPPPSPQPSKPAVGLIVLDPSDGSASTDRAITVRGIAQPGAPITQDILLWPDNHTTADTSGEWSFVETLNQGWNMFRFRVGDDPDTAVTINVYFGG